MESSLVVVTVLSLAMAASLSVVLWRLLRQERRRGDARVAALAALAAEPVARPAFKPRITVAPMSEDRAPRTESRVSQPAPDDLPLNPRPSRPSHLEPPSAPLDPRPSVATQALFASRETSAPAWGYRLLVMAALALVGATVVLFVLTSQARSTTQGRVLPRGAAAASNNAPALELLSLRDARQGDGLTISGVVRNPRGNDALNRVTVTALTFDASGAYVATGRALLDVTALAPGDESPFVVTVPSATNVARYRIAFRAEDGRVIAHTDKRQSTPVADVTTAALRDKVTP